MASPSPWPIIHAEREALIADLGTLTGEQWATRSLCANWTVRDVLGHMIATAKMTPPKFFVSMAAVGFRFNNMTARGVAREATANPADGLANFRSHVNDTTAPPGPVEAMLGEAGIHSADIRTPPGKPHAAGHRARVPGGGAEPGGGLLQGVEPDRRRQAADRRAVAARHGHRLVHRQRPRGRRAAPVADSRHDRAFRRARRPVRCGRGH